MGTEGISRRSGRAYGAVWVLFLASLGMTLLTLVDIRRGFLLPEYAVKTPWVSLSELHLGGLILGCMGLVLAYSSLQRAETAGGFDRARLRSVGKAVILALAVLLAADTLLLYRGVAAVRIVERGQMGIGALGLSPGQLPGQAELLPLAGTPLLLRPVAIAVNYWAMVWHATLLALLWAGLGVVAIPLYFSSWIHPVGAGRLRALLGGVAYAVPQPFCSCCAAPIAASIYKAGRTENSLVASTAFLLASPALNVTTLFLAATLLPRPYALLRILGGAFLVFLTTYLVATVAARLPWRVASDVPLRGIGGLVASLLNRYSRLLRFEPVGELAVTPVGLIRAWLWSTWRVARVVVPLLMVGSLGAGAIVAFVPSVFTNTVPGILLAAGLGTVLMVATWTEIPVAAVLAARGLTGPAAALLITLPVVSLPCLLIFGVALGNSRVPLLLGAVTFGLGVIAGWMFM
ncbi:hypothetical protein HRbin11_01591 [bacterium HR11]|nr:hypothetical protein HRbin11_01591 [bacterium HR11]